MSQALCSPHIHYVSTSEYFQENGFFLPWKELLQNKKPPKEKYAKALDSGFTNHIKHNSSCSKSSSSLITYSAEQKSSQIKYSVLKIVFTNTMVNIKHWEFMSFQVYTVIFSSPTECWGKYWINIHFIKNTQTVTNWYKSVMSPAHPNFGLRTPLNQPTPVL